jgi:hypothetical protein
LGPVGWARGRIDWWAFDTDVPEDVTHADLVLTPSARAAAICARDRSYSMLNVSQIWDGPEIVIPGIPIQKQHIEMMRVDLPKKGEIDYALEQMDPADAATQVMKRDGATDGARAQLEERCAAHPDDAMARFELGCVLTAEGNWTRAMQRFVETLDLHKSLDLTRRIRREERRLCALWLHDTGAKKAESMAALGAAYENGWGVAADLQEAKRWYRDASNAGSAGAMCRLASLYEREAGATVHTEQSSQWYRQQTREWYRKAADLGNEEAKKWFNAHE